MPRLAGFDIKKSLLLHTIDNSFVLLPHSTIMAIPPHPKLDGFDVLQTPYKTIGDHEIRTDILVPQAAHQGKRPVLIRIHGGGLVCTTH